MAESEWVRNSTQTAKKRRRLSVASSDEMGGDSFFKGVEEFVAANNSSRHESQTERMTIDSSEDVFKSIPGSFNDTDAVVIEARNGSKCTFGSGILLQDPATWGKIDKGPRHFVLTAAHCVCTYNYRGLSTSPDIRIRVPKKPWQNFPQDKKKYPNNMRKKKELFLDIAVNPFKQVFIHPKYHGNWWEGTDIALIALTSPIFPSKAGANKIFDIMRNKLWYDQHGSDSMLPTSCAIVGFPFSGKFSHYPFVSLTNGDGIIEVFQNETKALQNGSMVRYRSYTSGGMSGGSVELDGKIVGIHNAGDDQQGFSNGLLFTDAVKHWIKQCMKRYSLSPLAEVHKAVYKGYPGIATLLEDGTVLCSGDAHFPRPEQKNLVHIRSIVHSSGAFAVKKHDGTVISWGESKYGGKTGDKQSELVDIVCIGSAWGAFAAMKSDGRLICWGQESYFSDAIADCKKRRPIRTIARASIPMAHRDVKYILYEDGFVDCSDDSSTPKSKLSQLTNVEFVACTRKAVAAGKRDGTVVVWGDKFYGGDPGSKQSELTDVEFIASTDSAFAAKKHDGSVVTWGDARNGGDPGSKQSQLIDIESITSTLGAFAAKKHNGTVVVWGNAQHGGAQWQLTDVESIASTHSAFAAKKRDGTVVAWGGKFYDGRRYGANPGSKQPQLIDVEFIASTDYAFAAKKRDGTVVAWGGAGGDTGPKQSQLIDVESITSGMKAFAARKSDGTVVVWGVPEYGGEPGVKQSQLTDVELVVCARRSFAAKKRDGTVVTWGYHDYMGHKRSELVDVIFIASGGDAFAAMKRDGSIICWGNSREFDIATANCRKLKYETSV